MHTTTNAISVPIDTSSPRIVTGSRPATVAATAPVSKVENEGVLNFGWTLRKIGGSRPSRDIA
jgi:hypothetical protein